MTFSYDISTNVGKVRCRIGDVVSGAKLSLSDEEITYRLGLFANDILLTAYKCALDLKARASRIVSGGPQAPDRGSLLRQIDEVINDIASELPVGIHAGGVYQADVDATEELEDSGTLVPTPFRVGQDDHPGTTEENDI